MTASDDDGWRYYALVDPPRPPYGVIRQRGAEIERWSPTRSCWYVAMFHADMLWRGEPGKRQIDAAAAQHLLLDDALPDLSVEDVDALNRG